MQPDVADLADGRRGWWRRARGSVRLRVTVIAAGVFAVTLLIAAFALLRALEGALVDDVRAADRAALMAQARAVMVNGLPHDMLQIEGASGSAVALPYPGTRRVVAYAPSPAELAEPGTFVQEIYNAQLVPDEGARLLGIEGDADQFTVSTLPVGGVVLATASPLDAVRDTLASTRQLLWVIGPVLVALVAGLAWVLAGRALRPVLAVTSRVAEITSHSLHERVPEPASSDEIAELARTMNGMLGRLESATTSSRQLVSDASHELRTPITVMRAELEVARRTADPDWQASASVLALELDRLQGLVDDLLLLARADEQRARSGRAGSDVSLVDVVHDAASRPRRVPVDVVIGSTGVPPVAGDESAVRRAVDHVVANAARHATGTVRITVGSVDGEVRVDVDDDGPGIPVHQRSEVVRRFVRLDEGRDRDAGGAGLGLAVSADVARAHGGYLRIADSPLGGARVTLTLPSNP